jgi:hypothetical protein
MKTRDAVKHIATKLKKDKEWRLSWTASITMAYMDTYNSLLRKRLKTKALTSKDMHNIATEASELFMSWMCDELKSPEGH